jgi:hypothetical protein
VCSTGAPTSRVITWTGRCELRDEVAASVGGEPVDQRMAQGPDLRFTGLDQLGCECVARQSPEPRMIRRVERDQDAIGRPVRKGGQQVRGNLSRLMVLREEYVSGSRSTATTSSYRVTHHMLYRGMKNTGAPC